MGNWMGYFDAAAFIMEYDDMMEFNFGYWSDTINWGVDENNELTVEGLGFKSVNVGKTRINGIELSITGNGQLTKNLELNLLAGYTYINSKSLEPDVIYYESSYVNGFQIDTNVLTYNNTSSDPSTLKYRYKHIAKCDAELKYKKYSIGTSLRYNDFMKNIDLAFTDPIVASFIPDINQAREKFKNGDFIIDCRTSYQINEIDLINKMISI